MREDVRTGYTEREPGAGREGEAGWEVAWALEARTAELVQRWIARSGTRDLAPEQDLADSISLVVSWINRSLNGGPALETDTMEALSTIARSWRNEGITVSEALIRFGVLSRVLHEETRTTVAALDGKVDVEFAARVVERVSDAVMLAQSALAEAYRKTEEDRYKGFTTTLIHEVRNPLAAPLAAVKTFQVLEGKGELDPKIGCSDALERIEQAIWQASETVHAVESLTSPGTEDESLKPLQDVVTQVLAEFRQDAGNVDLACPGNLPDILVPGEAVLLALQNLVRNAIAYADPSEPAPFVRITCERDRDARRWLLRVSDNGIGISRADQSVVFKRFRRGRGAPGAGRGLGLSIVKTAAFQLGGLVEVESEPGQGSTFTITLPFDRVRPGPAATGGRQR